MPKVSSITYHDRIADHQNCLRVYALYVSDLLCRFPLGRFKLMVVYF